jgi:hypothetical protein
LCLKLSNESDATDLIGTTLSTSFTQPVTFRRRHHSLPYSILRASPHGLHPNVTFPQDSQNWECTWESLGFHPLHSLAFVKVCFTPKHIISLMGLCTSHLVANTMLGLQQFHVHIDASFLTIGAMMSQNLIGMTDQLVYVSRHLNKI